MSAYQLFVVFFGAISLAASIWAIWCVARSNLRYKVAWIVGSLIGFVGFGLNWTRPDNLILLFGVGIPPVMVFTVIPTGMWIVKTQFPFIALVALKKSEFGYAPRADE